MKIMWLIIALSIVSHAFASELRDQENFYALLGVRNRATQEEITEAFKAAAKRYHPNKIKGDAQAEAKFKQIAGAYQILSDPRLRQQYDEAEAAPWAPTPQGAALRRGVIRHGVRSADDALALFNACFANEQERNNFLDKSSGWIEAGLRATHTAIGHGRAMAKALGEDRPSLKPIARAADKPLELGENIIGGMLNIPGEEPDPLLIDNPRRKPAARGVVDEDEQTDDEEEEVQLLGRGPGGRVPAPKPAAPKGGRAPAADPEDEDEDDQAGVVPAPAPNVLPPVKRPTLKQQLRAQRQAGQQAQRPVAAQANAQQPQPRPAVNKAAPRNGNPEENATISKSSPLWKYLLFALAGSMVGYQIFSWLNKDTKKKKKPEKVSIDEERSENESPQSAS